MKKILWLASWYPNESEPYSGDFIQRQAEAVSGIHSISVLYVGKTESVVKNDQYINQSSTNLEQNIVLYSVESGFFSRWKSFYIYLKKHYRFIKDLKKKDALPDLVHVQVAMKAGLIALYLKWRFKVPYVLTEHWSGYYAASKDSLFRKSFFNRYATKQIIKNAARFLPVSEALGNQICRHWVLVPFQPIPNLVNTMFFFPAKNKETKPFRFIHISSLLYPKNPEGILKAFVKLMLTGIDAELVLVGPVNNLLKQLIAESGPAADRVRMTGEVSYEQVGVQLRHADALILFSFYENMPCVMLEALCTGIPVIASRVGGIPEVIDFENGILIDAGNEIQLQEAMQEMIRNYDSFKRSQIATQAASQFSYEVISKKIVSIYSDVIGGIN